MSWLDYVSIGSTVFSIVAAVKSNIYYKKSKQLTIYANTNSAYTESQKIIDTLTQLLKLGNNRRKRGINYINEVCQHGESIKSSINKIRENLPVKDFAEINELLNSQQTEVEKYIDSFITGTVLVEEKLVIDDNFYECQQTFHKMQMLIKRKLENIGEKLK